LTFNSPTLFTTPKAPRDFADRLSIHMQRSPRKKEWRSAPRLKRSRRCARDLSALKNVRGKATGSDHPFSNFRRKQRANYRWGETEIERPKCAKEDVWRLNGDSKASWNQPTQAQSKTGLESPTRERTREHIERRTASATRRSAHRRDHKRPAWVRVSYHRLIRSS